MGKSTAALSFPNPSRSYDASRHCVCFWGYDNSREIAFLVDDAMLTRMNPEMGSGEAELLAAFDRNRERILVLAKGMYSRGPQNRYLIV
jgi:hypothetical protein